ncbi:prolyl oligopeptidase family serine peptidase [Hymenobacter sp. NBH84]|uniref:carboxylesterase family protein n=1 Tax=Hymenobacter sp. NBH84 TaxID=2596915 RepID=UPI0016262AB3|nr:prolyl oligopeptidase family serine peptidase [Hymenobacter sp. NBH84]QNE39045.1 prolyl oligopeptidase family serine peptidase [Hymenobacter sp. NBH84]
MQNSLFRYLLIYLLTFTCITTAQAQQESGFQPRTYAAKDGHSLPYRILYPENYDPAKKYPLILVLHGAGERGSDNQKQLTHGSKLFLTPENRQRFPAIVVFPQCPENSYWAATQIDRTKHPLDIQFRYADGPKWPLRAALDLVQQLRRQEHVDKKRVYIMGLSMGGMGTFEALYREPKLFAAATPICGGGEPSSVKRYAKRLPLWVFHGSADDIVAPKYSREMVAALQQAGAQVKYTEYPGVNHNSWDSAFAEPELLPWLFSQHK